MGGAGPGPGVPVGPGPGAAPGGGAPSPDEIKKQLVMLVSEAKKIADQNNVDFSSVLSEVEGNAVKADRPLPRPPAPQGPPMG
jgi:hypothetical protein